VENSIMNLTIEIEDIKQKSLELVALEKGKQITDVIKELIDDYLRQRSVENEENSFLMKLSESSFNEWDNEEDAVYDIL
jgi:hypothetical protein